MSDRQLTATQVKLLRLADYLENIPDFRFDMSTLFVSWDENGCGSVGCIAGHAYYCFKGEHNTPWGQWDTYSFRVFMGLGFTTTGQLTTPPGWREFPRQYSRSLAVQVLRNLAMTGEVNWKVKL